MKKKFMLLLLPLTLLCGCNESNSIEDRKYVKGEEAAPIKQELSNKLKVAAENFSMKGIEENLEFSLSGSIDSINDDRSGTTVTNFSASLNESAKAVFDENELKAATPDYAKVAKLESKTSMEFTMSSVADGMPVSMGGKYDIDAKYGYANIKPVGSETSVSSDFLFAKVSTTMSQGEDSQTLTTGALGYGIADAMVKEIKNQQPSSTPDSSTGVTGTTGVTITEEDLNLILESLKDYVGYAKSKNKYYVSFDLAGLNSLITPAPGVNISFKGNIYAEVDFSKDDKFTGFSLVVKDVSVSMSMADAGISALNTTINGKFSVKEFNGDVAAPTQADVDALGYDKVTKLEIAY